MKKQTKAGVAVAIWKDNKILLGLRKGSHAAGTWAFPGGHVEYMEDPKECCVRETLEESGIEIKNVKFWTYTNDIFPEDDKHFICLVFTADWSKGEARIMEPNKCEKWEWFDWKELPEPLMTGIYQLKKLKNA